MHNMQLEQLAPASPKVWEARSDTARRILEERRIRTDLFGNGELFSEPAWDILLYLFHGCPTGKGKRIKGISFASRLSGTSTLRCLERLETKGFVFAYRNEKEENQIYVRLSPKGTFMMEVYLDRAGSAYGEYDAG